MSVSVPVAVANVFTVSVMLTSSFSPVGSFSSSSVMSSSLPPPVSCSATRPRTKHHSVGPRCHISGCIRGCPYCSPYLPTRPCRSCGLGLLHASVAEGNAISSAVGALFQRMTTEWSLLCHASHHVSLVVNCPVITRAVARCEFAGTFVLDVTPSPAELTPRMSARVRERFNSVSHSHRLDASPDLALCCGAPFISKMLNDSNVITERLNYSQQPPWSFHNLPGAPKQAECTTICFSGALRRTFRCSSTLLKLRNRIQEYSKKYEVIFRML